MTDVECFLYFLSDCHFPQLYLHPMNVRRLKRSALLYASSLQKVYDVVGNWLVFLMNYVLLETQIWV